MAQGVGLALIVALLLVAGCSAAVEKKRQAYRASESIAPLQVPDSLTPPPSDNALMLPVFQQPRPAADAPPFDTRPPAPANLPSEAKPKPGTTPASKPETRE